MTVYTIARATVAAAAAGLITAAAMPALAQPSSTAKPVKVTVPSAALTTGKLCMSKSKSRIAAKDKTLPATLCQTVDEWAAHGVEIVTK
jgi:hypothetical protein